MYENKNTFHITNSTMVKCHLAELADKPLFDHLSHTCTANIYFGSWVGSIPLTTMHPGQ